MSISGESNGNGFYMPVAPAYNQGGMNGFGGDWAWIILLLLAFGGGWGMGGFGGGFGADGLYPWLNNSQNINGGFRDQMLNTSITSIGDKITSGFGDVQTALCGGFAGVNANISNSAAQGEISANARQMANMNQLFSLQSALQQCCCDNRAGIADLKYTVATENCADRYEAANNTRDIIDSQTRSTQAILDKLCQLELDGYKRENESLRSQLTDAKFAASQTAQTAAIRAGQVEEVDALYNRLSNCPVPSMPVYGSQPIFTCQNNGCGCGVA